MFLILPNGGVLRSARDYLAERDKGHGVLRFRG
jgi:hypothetical protein